MLIKYKISIVNQSATASGVQMTANSGTGLYIRKAEIATTGVHSGTGLYIRKAEIATTGVHSGTFSEKAEIKGTLNNAKFEPCTSASETSGTVTPNSYTAFKPSFATLKGVKSDDTTKLEYTTITGKNIKDTDVYGVTTTSTEGTTTTTIDDATTTTAYYYNFKIDYMITTGKSLKIGVENVKVVDKEGTVISGTYAKDEYYYATKDDGTKEKTKATEAATVTAGADEASLDKATRVAFIDATAYNDDNTVSYADEDGNTTGTEYAIASTCNKTDHNYNALKELGYTGASEYTYDDGQDNLTEKTHTVSTPTGAKTTNDKSFTYGSVDVYVWFDGTDKACTNAIFSQKVTFDKCLFI